MSEERTYTLTLEQVNEIIDGALEGFEVSRGMLKHHLNDEQSPANVCALLAELFWASFNIKKMLEDELLSSELSEDGHMIISEKVLAVLQTLVYSKELASQELNKFSISTKLN